MSYERLTQEDIEAVVAEMLDISASNPELTFHQKYLMAQTVLPEDKRYTPAVVYQRNKWSNKLKTALQGAGVWPGYVPPTTANWSSEPPPPPDPPVIETPPQVVVPEVKPKSNHPSELIAQLYDSIREDIRSELFEAMNSKIEEQVRIQVKSLLITEEEAATVAGADEKRETLRDLIERAEIPTSILRIFVIGLLGEQIIAIRRKMIGVPVELRFWKDEAQSKLRDNIAWADEILIMTKFVSHSTVNMVAKTAREKLKYCNGAVSDLERQINHLHNEFLAKMK